jgi:5'-3' exoribonuclease 2
MGIPFYFRKVATDFPRTIQSHPTSKCDRLYLDFNCAIHHCCHETKKAFRKQHVPDFEALLIQNVCQYIDTLVAYAKPSELVYIAIDGIPPFAKIIQQRKRRYMSAYTKQQCIEELKQLGGLRGCNAVALATAIETMQTDWDTNAISPGTPFMNKLSSAIRDHISKKQNLKYILSDAEEPGEGEQKIFQHIASSPKETTDCVIYGLDADLIMLSLFNCDRRHQIRLLREQSAVRIQNHTGNGYFVYVDVNCLREQIVHGLRSTFNTANEDLMIHCYVFLCFLLGNDFLPNLSYIHVNDVDTLLSTYKTVSQKTKSDILIESNGKFSIHTPTLLALIEALAEPEDQLFLKAHTDYFNSKVSVYYPNQTDLQTPDNLIRVAEQRVNGQKSEPVKVYPEQKGWRLQYYHYLFGQSENVIEQACKNYIQGLGWMIDYYFHRRASPNWYYNFNYSPTSLDLYNYLVSTQSLYAPPSPGELPVVDSTALQLLCILPPTSISKSINIRCLYMFPRQFKITKYLRKALWECHPELPKIDVNLLKLVEQ